MGSFSSWADFWPSKWGLGLFVLVCALLIVTLVIASMALDKADKSGFSSSHGSHGGHGQLTLQDAGDQPGYAQQKPHSQTGANALLCGGTAAQKAAANALSGEALEAQLLGAMDDYMSASDIALDKAIGSTYSAGASSAGSS
jgi:hypothetical protein